MRNLLLLAAPIVCYFFYGPIGALAGGAFSVGLLIDDAVKAKSGRAAGVGMALIGAVIGGAILYVGGAL